MKTYEVTVTSGITSWYNTDGQLHREDGPAVEYSDGSKKWYINGQRHREDGPAVEYSDDYKVWYINGQLHREDGPAVEYPDGSKEWYINGQKLTEKEFNKRNKKEITIAEIEKILRYSIKIIK